jgi:hypothetical protein
VGIQIWRRAAALGFSGRRRVCCSGVGVGAWLIVEHGSGVVAWAEEEEGGGTGAGAQRLRRFAGGDSGLGVTRWRRAAGHGEARGAAANAVADVPRTNFGAEEAAMNNLKNTSKTNR